MTMEKCDGQQGGTADSTSAGQEVDRNHFPSRLHAMLSSLENNPDGLGGVVHWQPHGRVFKIRDADLFVQHVLPKWFCRLKYTSFQRQLCLYGFRKLTKKGPDHGGYYHLSFVRDRLDLAKTIEPGKIKGKRGRRPKNDENEPNFYQLFLREQRAARTEAVPASAPAPTAIPAAQAKTPALPKEPHMEDLLFNFGPKEESPEQLSLEAIMQQPHFQEEILEFSQPGVQPRQLADTKWPSIPIQQSLTTESHTVPQRASVQAAEANPLQAEKLFLAQVAPPTDAKSVPRTAVARRLSGDLFASTLGWDSLPGTEELSLRAMSSSQKQQAHISSLATLQDSPASSQPQQLHVQQRKEPQLQHLLRQQQLIDLMDLKQKQQKNLKIQQEQLEQQRSVLQRSDQEQLDQLRIELQSREQQQLHMAAREHLQRQQQRRRSKAGRMAEPLPRPPALFKPQLQGVTFPSSLQRQSPPQAPQPQQGQRQQQQQRPGQGQIGTFQGLFKQHPL